ncbi:MAG: ornithine--oxo-acid transaminase [Candidatus Eremiobacteraeota bacterium]|nr:ornithine--oxo-acid transaminase [Candidatus Eremiobacteraeota bacterium]
MHGQETQALDLIALEDRYGAHNYHPLDLVVERASGVWLYDVDGRRYLDCVSAYSAVNQGHCHPRVAAALVEQAGRVSLTSRAMRNDRLPLFLRRLTEYCGFDMALPTNTGVEAVETGIKLARRWGYDVKGIPEDAAEIIVFNNNFHGRTLLATSASSTPEYRRAFGPHAPGFIRVPFGDFDAVRSAITANTAGVLLEPIQGEAGVIVPPEGFISRVRELCTQQNVLLIADEVQTGFGRTGDRFACDHERVRPDILLVGKALGAGYYPISAALADRALMELFVAGEHGSTFGGNPLASAVGIASLDVLEDEDLANCARARGRQLMDGLRDLRLPAVAQVRGRGLLVGVAVHVPARDLATALLQRGVAAKDTHETVLRLAPPLVIDEAQVDFLLETFREAVASL